MVIERPLLIENNGAMEDSSAMLQVESLNKGFLPPRMTTAERDLIQNPAPGLMVFTLDDDCLNFFNGFSWFKKCCDPGPQNIGDVSVEVLGNSIIIDFDLVPGVDTFHLLANPGMFSREITSAPAIVSDLPPDIYTLTLSYMTDKCGIQNLEFENIEVGLPGLTGIGSFQMPGKDCRDIKSQDPGKADGKYYVDPDGAGGRDPFICYCDMSADGGGWASIFYGENSIGAEGPSQCIFPFNNDDHDSYILWQDLTLKLANSNTNATSTQNWYTWERDGDQDIMPAFLPDRPAGMSSAARPLPMPGMVSTAWLDPNTDLVFWRDKTFAFDSLGLNTINSLNSTSSTYFITDGINKVHVGNINSQAILLKFDYEIDTITHEVVTPLSNINSYNTEQDAFLNVLWTVNGRPTYYNGNFNFAITGSLADPNLDTGTIFNIPGMISSTQFGLDFFGRVDNFGNLWLVDWGHDNGGYFGCGNDNQLGVIKTTITITDFLIGN